MDVDVKYSPFMLAAPGFWAWSMPSTRALTRIRKRAIARNCPCLQSLLSAAIILVAMRPVEDGDIDTVVAIVVCCFVVDDEARRIEKKEGERGRGGLT